MRGKQHHIQQGRLALMRSYRRYLSKGRTRFARSRVAYLGCGALRFLCCLRRPYGVIHRSQQVTEQYVDVKFSTSSSRITGAKLWNEISFSRIFLDDYLAHLLRS